MERPPIRRPDSLVQPRATSEVKGRALIYQEQVSFLMSARVIEQKSCLYVQTIRSRSKNVQFLRVDSQN